MYRHSLPRCLPAFALLLLASLPCTSCAATVGTVAGPVTGPMTFWRHTYGTPDWVKVLLVPLAIGAGPLMGLVEGARADIGYVVNGEYGSPPFDIVFDPCNTELERPPMTPMTPTTPTTPTTPLPPRAP